MLVAPSLLSADFCNLQHELEMLGSSRADYVHIDVMDGVYVPNITIGFPVIKSISTHTNLPLDVHLMIVEPQKYVSQVRDAGATFMTIHAEASTHIHSSVQMIKHAGMKAGVALNPGTPLVMLEDIITDLDMVLVMSVNPGFGGQSFITHSLDKIALL
jgi:ribulose-phosphate 3-epimerase